MNQKKVILFQKNKLNIKINNQKSSMQISLLIFISFLLVTTNSQFDQAQPIPTSYDGTLIYGSQRASSNYFLLEAYYDLLDPDSANSFTLLESVIKGKNLSSEVNFNMIVHLFPMPINMNSYPLSMGMRFINDNYDAQLALDYMKLIFNSQSQFWYTETMSEQNVEQAIAELVMKQKTFSEKFNQSTFVNAFSNTIYDGEVRVSWKYACSRNVFQTPTYFVNGILLNNAEGYDAEDWEAIFSQFFSQ